MTFTGALGTASSVLGNIVLGAAPSSGGGSATGGAVPQIVGTIPIPHVPWLGFHLAGTTQQGPPASASTLPPSSPPFYNPFVQGVPIANVPWNVFKTPFIPTAAAKPPPPPPAEPPLLYDQIPVFGVPWLNQFLAKALPSLQNLQIAPPPPGMPLAWTPVAPGVPIEGVPWTARLPGFSVPVQPSSPPKSPPPPPPAPGRPTSNLPFVPRVPDLDTQHGQERFRRFTELVQTLFNSLLSAGYIVPVGINTYAIRGGGFSGARGPVATDDASVGVNVGSTWVNTVSHDVYVNVVNAIGSAVWVKVS